MRSMETSGLGGAAALTAVKRVSERRQGGQSERRSLHEAKPASRAQPRPEAGAPP